MAKELRTRDRVHSETDEVLNDLTARYG